MDKRLLTDYAKRLGIALDSGTTERIIAFGEALLIKNEAINLTSVRDKKEFLIKHLCDSLTVASLPELDGETADVGTGGGFPGVVIKILCPKLSVTLIDSTQKKLLAVKDICEGLNLSVKFVHRRAEQEGRGEHRDFFETVTARSLAAMPRLLEYCLPLVREGGFFLAMKGPGVHDEIEAARSAERILCGRLIRTVDFELPGGAKRTIAVYQKTAPTPENYPRPTGQIVKKPVL